ncbi:hypothetical protein EGM51_16215 [Verrucomicrobia bacterium S94]|nr:hypothetical protein EGM51_16215 [Verrucomicrobia bacterium S94]
MNKFIHILLMLALLPVVVSAREETLEERKQRIVRKYLRENATITQSEIVVPSEMEEDERLLESEKFRDTKDMSLEREEPLDKPFIPPPPARPVPKADVNWLLGDSDEEVTEFDMYGNPIDSASVESEDNLWSWDRSGKDGTERRRETYSRDGERRAERSVRDYFGRETRVPGDGERASSPFQTDSGLFGRSRNTYSSGFGLQGNRRTFGADPEEGLLSPFPQYRSSDSSQQYGGTTGSGTQSRQGHQPYQSAYEQEREQRRKQWEGLNQNLEKQEEQFKRPDTYQRWKERNKSYDPLADDAYLNPQNR